MIAKTALIAVTVLSFFLVLLFPMAMIIPVIIGCCGYRFYSSDFDTGNLKYLYVNGDLDIDKIMANKKKKSV